MTIRVSPGTRGARVPTALVKLIGRRQIRTYRRSGEQRVSSRAGFPVVLLTTRGAKTGAHGQPRSGAFRTERTLGSSPPRCAGPPAPVLVSRTWQSIPTTCSGRQSWSTAFTCSAVSRWTRRRSAAQALARSAKHRSRCYRRYQQATTELEIRYRAADPRRHGNVRRARRRPTWSALAPESTSVSSRRPCCSPDAANGSSDRGDPRLLDDLLTAVPSAPTRPPKWRADLGTPAHRHAHLRSPPSRCGPSARRL